MKRVIRRRLKGIPHHGRDTIAYDQLFSRLIRGKLESRPIRFNEVIVVGRHIRPDRENSGKVEKIIAVSRAFRPRIGPP